MAAKNARGKRIRAVITYLILIPLIAVGVVVSTVVCLRKYAAYRGAVVSQEFLEGEALWKQESDIGYINRENLNEELLGNIRIQTNSSGLRSDREVSYDKADSVTRVLGIGDSIMWGLRLKYEDTFMQVANRILKKKGQEYEFINGGVVGYSTLQEKLYLFKYGLSYNPDIVVLSFCPNDWLPSDDLYSQGLAVYRRYFQHLLTNSSHYPLSRREREILQVLVQEEDLQTMYSLFWKDEGLRNSFRKILIEIPLVQMLHATREKGARFIVTFTPNQFYSATRLQTIHHLEELLRLMEGEFINMSDALVEPSHLYADFHHPLPQFEETPMGKFVVWTGASEVFSAAGLKGYDPYMLTKNLSKVRRLHAVNAKRNFSDWVHPTRRGAWLIGNELADYLIKSGS